MASQLLPTAREAILAIVQEAVPGVIAVYQFGSTIRGEEHAESDLDLAVLAPASLENLGRWELQEDLAATLHRDVDLVDLRVASTVMQAQVVDQGDVLLESDRTARQRFEMNVCTAYALLNEERADIIEDVQARGARLWPMTSC